MRADRRIEPWPVAMAALLAGMIVACLSFWAIAAAHPDPEVVEDAYVAGLRLNDELRAARRARERGLALALETRAAQGGVDVRVVVTHAEGGTRTAERVVVRRERPAEGGFDADYELAPAGEAFTGRVPLPRPGRWRLVATATVDGEPVRQSFQLGDG